MAQNKKADQKAGRKGTHMELLLFWPVVGAMVGYIAAGRKGLSPAAGILGGMILGILSPLMFCVSGTTRKDASRKCPFCAEWVKAEATVCKHCRRDIPASTPEHGRIRIV